jgi:hypothetical protein
VYPSELNSMLLLHRMSCETSLKSGMWIWRTLSLALKPVFVLVTSLALAAAAAAAAAGAAAAGKEEVRARALRTAELLTIGDKLWPQTTCIPSGSPAAKDDREAAAPCRPDPVNKFGNSL